MKKFLPRPDEEGFSLIELVIVIAVLTILAVVSGPYFLKVLNMARFSAAKMVLSESYTKCVNDSNQSPNAPMIPGIAFQSTNCSSLMSATIDETCTISLDLSNGTKTGWADSFDSCSSTNGGGNGNDNGNNNGNGNGNGSNLIALENYCNNDPKPSSCRTTGLGGYAVVHDDGTVAGVTVSTSDDPWGTGPGVMPMDYMGCPAGCRLIRQTNPSETGNVAGWSGQNVNYSNGVFTLEDGTQIKDGVGIRPNGEIFDTGTNEILN